MKNLEVGTQNKENDNVKDLGNVFYLNHKEDKIILRDVEVEIVYNGNTLFVGSKFELFSLLESCKKDKEEINWGVY
jgi:hypothetical protein